MRSLGVRLALWYSVGIAALLLLLGAFLYVALDRYLTGQAYELLLSQARPLQVLASEERSLTGAGSLVTQITQRPAATGVGVAVIGPGGQLLGRNLLGGDQPLPNQAAQQLRQLQAGKPAVQSIFKENGVRYLQVSEALRFPNTGIGALVLSTSLAPVDATLRGFVFILLVGIGATLLIAGLIVVVVTHLGFRPLREMTLKSLAMAEGDLDQRMDEDTSLQEVRQLAASLNLMAWRLQGAFQAQRQFAADASHELRTPLTSIAGYIDVLNKGAKDEPQTRDHILTAMRNEVDRMTGLVRDLVSLARMDAAEDLQLQRVDLSRVVEDVYEQTKAMAPQREVSLRRCDGAWVDADVDRIRQVLLNLADNAIKYTPPEANINFAVQSYDSTVQVSVADTGPGIPPRDLPKIFDRFYRTEHSRTREKGGAGLGLAIAKRIVEAHKGTINAASPATGGTVFDVRLPAAR